MSTSAKMRLRSQSKSQLPPVRWRDGNQHEAEGQARWQGFRSLVKRILRSVTGTRYLGQEETRQATATHLVPEHSGRL
jgi:hypothetical protein